jgi:hypothetical protein
MLRNPMRWICALICASCIGPTLVHTQSDDLGRSGTVSFRGREGFGYVTAEVMAQRNQEAVALAQSYCDGGVDVTEKRSEGHTNFVEFRCSGEPKKKPCVEPREK